MIDSINVVVYCNTQSSESATLAKQAASIECQGWTLAFWHDKRVGSMRVVATYKKGIWFAVCRVNVRQASALL